jgi:hypothetical protein
MMKYPKTLYIVGAICTILGSFLPWQQEGDFISYWIYGLQIYPFIRDNGGFLIVVLSVILIWLALWAPPTRRMVICRVLFSYALLIVSGYHIGKWLIRRVEALGVVGAPSLQIGLIAVFSGSLILLFAAILDSGRQHVI